MSGTRSQGKLRLEIAALALLLLLGLVPRLAFVTAFPTQPVSDFLNLLQFARTFQNVSWTAPTAYWDFFSPGLPLALSLLLRVVPGEAADTGRLATAVLTGLLPLLPFFLWRGCLPLWARCLAGGMLALWPGQIAFSGVIAQDNWVLPPAVALGCLAARSLILQDTGRPIAAGLLYALTVAMRQEMLVVLLPLLPAAAGLGNPQARRARNTVVCLLAAAVPLLLLATQRELATGRFALSSAHGGVAVLGSYIPGATANAWADPLAYVASVEPDLLRDPDLLRREAGRLAVREALRRPGYHAARIAATTLSFAFEAEAANLYWVVLAPGALPPETGRRGPAFVAWAGTFLKREMALLQALFLTAAILAVAWRSRPMLALCLALALKAGLHAVTVSQGRYFLAVMALEILVIALAAAEAARRQTLRLPLSALVFSLVLVAGLYWIHPRAMAWVKARDVDPQRTYRFQLAGPGDVGGSLSCVVRQGRLTTLTRTQATLQPFARDPAPGDAATAHCELESRSPLAIRLLDSYAPGGLPNRIRQRVEVDGSAVLDHDLGAEPGEGWSAAPVAPGPRRQVLIRVLAVNPDPGAAWGRAATTTFELAKPEEAR